jgi:transposase InsO family protein
MPTHVGWLYLAVVLDLASRRVVGWAVRETLAESLTLDAVEMALQARRPAEGLVHHSDRGVQYASRAYRARLAAHRVTCSMSRLGDCWDNAVAESFFAMLEHELSATGCFRHTRSRAEPFLNSSMSGTIANAVTPASDRQPSAVRTSTSSLPWCPSNRVKPIVSPVSPVSSVVNSS